MNGASVILVTVAGPGGHVDVGVRSDATPAQLAAALSTVIGVGPALPVVEHRSPPRPGVPLGGRVALDPWIALAEAGVADGDLVLFAGADEPQLRPAASGLLGGASDADARGGRHARGRGVPGGGLSGDDAHGGDTHGGDVPGRDAHSGDAHGGAIRGADFPGSSATRQEGRAHP